MDTYVILDAGHGQETPGKRTPNFDDGSCLKEWQFNKAVVDALAKLLAFEKIPFFIVNPTPLDVPLLNRVERINKHVKSSDEKFHFLLLSVHANAHQPVPSELTWNDANGIEVFYYSEKGRMFAEFLQKNLIEQTKLRDRGAKKGNLYILKNTLCTAVLSENGFMTNRNEAELLKSPHYQQQVAEAHFFAVRDYRGNL